MSACPPPGHRPSRPRRRAHHRRHVPAGVLGLVLVLLGLTAATPAHADSYVTITGSGSSWSQVAIDAWRVDVHSSGLQVNYNGSGSTAGRLDYIKGLNDFGVSEIPFQDHPQDGSSPEVSPRPFAYLPIVAGGTSFMYHVTVAGKRITDLRLSGETVTKIFTGVITSWGDPQITTDYGRKLPDEPIVPVIRSDGSGTSAQFSLYMSKRYPALWNAFCVKYAHATAPCGLYSFYPGGFSPYVKSQNGSNGVADYVASSYAEGAITYVEYAYALNLGYPVAKLLNQAGYYTGPTASNVAVALTQARINADLTQDLDSVYANSDPRTYPLSSYSYMIVPTDGTSPFNATKGKTLSTFINYFLCQGQQKAPALGYSPLPLNLVQAGFSQVVRIPGSVAPPAISACNNPNFSGPDGASALVKAAPYPSPCDKAGADPTACGLPRAPGTQATTATVGGSRPGGAQPAQNGAAPGAGTGGTTTLASGTAATTAGAVPLDVGAVDPETGQALGAAAGGTGAATGAIVPVASSWSDATPLYSAMGAGELLLVVALPPAVAAFLRRRRTTA